MKFPHDIATASPEVQKHYSKMIADGVPERFAEMAALQSPPGLRGTDRTLMQNRLNNQQFDDMPKDHADNLIALARRAGINPTGKYYASSLADKRGPGDPEAWIDSAADVKRVAMKRNLTVTGSVQHKGTPMPRPESKPLSERLTREMMRAEKKRNPTMKKEELREYVVDRYGRKPKK